MAGLPQKNSNWMYPRAHRSHRRPNKWQAPKGDKQALELSERVSSWPSMEEQCKTATATAEISSGYKRAIALLRSLRNVSNEEAQRQRESWELLKQDLDDNKYH